MRDLLIRFSTGVAVLLTLAAGAPPAHAQAWLPAKGEGTVSLLFTNVVSRDHFLPDTRYDFGRIDSHTMLFEVAYGVSDRMTVSVGLPLVTARYSGNFPHRPITLDDGAWHTTAQDFRFGVRYNAVRGPLMITPFVGTDLPSNNYEYFAHAAPGRRLREIQGGVVAGHLFDDLGLVLQGRYSLAFSEGALDLPRRYSLAALEAAYFVTPAIRLIAMTAGRAGHTGIDLAPNSGRVLPSEVFQHHDQISREGYLNVGGGAALALNDRFDLFGSFTRTVTGRNTHAVNRGISLGLAWSFGRSSENALTAREDTLVKCLCQKAAP